MTINNLQNAILSLMNLPAGLSFFDLVVYDRFNSVMLMSHVDVLRASQLAIIFLLSDLVMYGGLIVMIITLGKRYAVTLHSALFKMLVVIGIVFIYLSVIINIVGLVFGLKYLLVSNLSLFDSSYTFSLFSQLAKLVMMLIAVCFSALSILTCTLKVQSLELPLLTYISVALSCVIFSSTNFALLLLALEGFSLVLYIMTTVGRVYGGVTAAVKYFAFGTLGSIFLFWGVVHLYSLVPSLSFYVVNALLLHSVGSGELARALEFATTLITFGFLVKVGSAPMHQWVADVYAGSSMFVTAFFSIFVKFTLVVVFLNIAYSFNNDLLLKSSALASLIVGCLLAIRQTEIKRLLAYSSIVHVAFLVMGDLTSSFLYLLTYVISSLLLFSVLLNSEIGGRELIYLNDFRFIRNSGYTQIFYLTVALASSAGLPPFAGFYGKFLVWSSLIEDIYLVNSVYSYTLLFISILISLVTIYYYMRVISYTLVSEDAGTRSVHLKSWAYNAFYMNFSGMQKSLSVFIVLWTLLHSCVLAYLQFLVI